MPLGFDSVIRHLVRIRQLINFHGWLPGYNMREEDWFGDRKWQLKYLSVKDR